MQRGFTIVELLIVIVVIGILAAISLVTYNGIQDKARDAKRTATVDAYEKILLIYKAQHGYFPQVGENAYCLGNRDDYPARDGFAEGACYVMSYNGTVYQTESVVEPFNGELQKVSSGRLPTGAYPPYSVNTPDGVVLHMRGVIVAPQGDNKMQIFYYSKDDGSPCGGRMEKDTDASMSGVKACSIFIN